MHSHLGLAAFAFLQASTATPIHGQAPVAVDASVPAGASSPLPEAFFSYSIEYVFLPEFAGNISMPNTFSNNLLDNLGRLQGTKPYIRVGGNTQDRAIYNANLGMAIKTAYDPAISNDYPAIIETGPSLFESLQTFPDTKYVLGLNMATQGNTTAGLAAVIDSAVTACSSLGDRLVALEYGNEPDMYATWWDFRQSPWNEEELVSQWLSGSQSIGAAVEDRCGKLPFIAPSFAFLDDLDPLLAWEIGLKRSSYLKLFSQHNYVGVATEPGLTLQGTLMNHSRTLASLAPHKKLMSSLAQNGAPPYILGEANSLARQGKPGISDAFGAALWNLDFALQSASIGVQRIHMHQGSNYRYASWQPVATNRTPIGTKPPYYGNIATAAFLGDLSQQDLQVTSLKMPSDELDAGYAAYVDGKIARIAVINLRTHNYTSGSEQVAPRSEQKYVFHLEHLKDSTEVKIDRLMANGSNVLSGITYGGLSYAYELDEGRAVRLSNVTSDEASRVGRKGLLEVTVPDASAAILNLVLA